MQDQAATTPRARMRQRLRHLYGDERGDAAHRELLQLLDAFPARPRTRQPGETFTEQDAILRRQVQQFRPVIKEMRIEN